MKVGFLLMNRSFSDTQNKWSLTNYHQGNDHAREQTIEGIKPDNRTTKNIP